MSCSKPALKSCVQATAWPPTRSCTSSSVRSGEQLSVTLGASLTTSQRVSTCECQRRSKRSTDLAAEALHLEVGPDPQLRRLRFDGQRQRRAPIARQRDGHRERDCERRKPAGLRQAGRCQTRCSGAAVHACRRCRVGRPRRVMATVALHTGKSGHEGAAMAIRGRAREVDHALAPISVATRGSVTSRASTIAAWTSDYLQARSNS